MAEVTVGVDIGTSSVKAVAVDATGAVVARARIPHQVEMPTPDVFQHDARAAWCDGVRDAAGQVGAGHRVLGITVAAMVPRRQSLLSSRWMSMQR